MLSDCECRRSESLQSAVPEKGNFAIAYQNLDTLDEIAGGTPFQANLSHDFKQTVPAGRYRVILKATTYPDAPKQPYFASVGVDVRDSSATVELPALPFPGQRKKFSQTT